MDELFTLGHSTHSVERFLELLRMHRINAIADVRSSPYSRHTPQFNREALQAFLKDQGIAYVFLGKELGARGADPSSYIDGQVQFNLLAQTDQFKQGLDRLRKGTSSYRITLLCAEKDPIRCHRMILVCRNLRADFLIQHILEDGKLEQNDQAERRLMRELRIPETDLFASEQELIDRAYDLQGKRIAYVEKSGENGEPSLNGEDS
jgi:uncharacterized protein (DUF488 family)